MVSRRFLAVVSIITTAAAFFLLGVFHERTDDAAVRANYDAKLDALRAELRTQLGKARAPEIVPASTMGDTTDGPSREPGPTGRERMIADIKRELQSEMGLLPLALLRDRRTSFVELYSTDNFGKTNYGTAGYLGDGYFVTVKHAVVALKDGDRPPTRKIVGIKILYEGKEIPAKLVDSGDADVEVHTGDWAIIKTAPLELPALKPNTSFAYDFAAPIFRLGNDYSKGIILSTGYVGQRMSSGLVSCLTDGHPGVSGGGVLDQKGDLVGIPIGRMQGDYRFSFILPVRDEMFRKIPDHG
jgi:Trypsin-like peptidase domain